MNGTDRIGGCQEWQSEARCQPAQLVRLKVSAEVFFPPDEKAPGAFDQAKAVCAGCPVTGECLSSAYLSRLDYGVYGGLTEPERVGLIRSEKGLAVALRLLALGEVLPKVVTNGVFVKFRIPRSYRGIPADLHHTEPGRRKGWWDRDELLAWALGLVDAWARSSRCREDMRSPMLELVARYELAAAS